MSIAISKIRLFPHKLRQTIGTQRIAAVCRFFCPCFWLKKFVLALTDPRFPPPSPEYGRVRFLYKKTPREIREESGACGRIRTGDLLITSELLCQLSHTSIFITFGSENQVLSYHKSHLASTPIFRVAPSVSVRKYTV